MEIGAVRTIKRNPTPTNPRDKVPTQETISTADSFFRRDKDEKGKVKRVKKKREMGRRREGNRHR
jgi:hypothetical protein